MYCSIMGVTRLAASGAGSGGSVRDEAGRIHDGRDASRWPAGFHWRRGACSRKSAAGKGVTRMVEPLRNPSCTVCVQYRFRSRSPCPKRDLGREQKCLTIRTQTADGPRDLYGFPRAARALTWIRSRDSRAPLQCDAAERPDRCRHVRGRIRRLGRENRPDLLRSPANARRLSASIVSANAGELEEHRPHRAGGMKSSLDEQAGRIRLTAGRSRAEPRTRPPQAANAGAGQGRKAIEDGIAGDALKHYTAPPRRIEHLSRPISRRRGPPYRHVLEQP